MCRSTLVLALASAVLLGSVQGVNFDATLPPKPFFAAAQIQGNVEGGIKATLAKDCSGVEFEVEFSNLPKEGGPFMYHIHAAPAVDGNCTSTKAHLDPTNRGEDPPCDASKPETCQVGDLSGKYGLITSDPFTAKFKDAFVSVDAKSTSYFGNLSFVLHYANKTRLTCANFEKCEDVAPNCYASGFRALSQSTSPTGVATATGARTTATVRSTTSVNSGASTPRMSMAVPILAISAAILSFNI